MSLIAQGINTQLAIDIEGTTYNVDADTPNSRLISFISSSMGLNRPLVTDDSINNSRNNIAPRMDLKDVSGDIVVNLDETSHAILMWNLLGADTITGSSDPWTHTMKNGARVSAMKGLVIEHGFLSPLATPLYYKYNGVIVASATFNFRPEGIQKTTFTLLGSGKETKSSSPYDATPTTLAHLPYDGSHITLQEEGGSTIATLASLDITISNENQNDVYNIGGNAERACIPEGKTLVTGTLVARFTDATLLDKAIAGTETSLQITLSKGSTPARSMDFFIPELQYEPASAPIVGPNGVDITLNFQGFFVNGATSSTIQCIITNGLETL